MCAAPPTKSPDIDATARHHAWGWAGRERARTHRASSTCCPRSSGPRRVRARPPPRCTCGPRRCRRPRGSAAPTCTEQSLPPIPEGKPAVGGLPEQRVAGRGIGGARDKRVVAWPFEEAHGPGDQVEPPGGERDQRAGAAGAGVVVHVEATVNPGCDFRMIHAGSHDIDRGDIEGWWRRVQ